MCAKIFGAGSAYKLIDQAALFEPIKRGLKPDMMTSLVKDG